MTLEQLHHLSLHQQCGASIYGFAKQNGSYASVVYHGYRKTAQCLSLIRERDQYFRRYVAPRMNHYTAPTIEVTVTEFSVKTGKPLVVLDRQATQDQGWTGVEWAGTTGTSLIVDVPGPPAGTEHIAQVVIGVQDGATFTPLPAAVQHVVLTEQVAW